MSDLDLEDPNELADAFEYLDDLRESGITNMFGAAPYLEREFGVSKENARSLLRLWQVTFSAEPAIDRARDAARAAP